MAEEKRNRSDRRTIILISVGIALFPIHNQWLIDATAINGKPILFFPAIGAAIWIMATLFFLLDNWNRVDWGDKRIFIPLVVLGAAIAISGFMNGDTLQTKAAPALLAGALLALYAVSRVLGPNLFRALVPFALMGVVIAIVMKIADPANLSGGMITNSAAIAGFLVFGAFANQVRRQWLLCFAALAGILVLGTLEGIFIVTVLGVIIAVRRDVSHTALIAVGALVAVVGISTALGLLIPLYNNNPNLSTLAGLVSGSLPINSATLDALTTGRWTINYNVLQHIQLFGRGLALTAAHDTAHNIPLVVAQQVGPIAAAAWVFVALYCLVKTKWKYMWSAVIAMSIFDHYLWTQFLPWIFVLVGVSSIPDMRPDLMLRTIKTNTVTAWAEATDAAR